MREARGRWREAKPRDGGGPPADGSVRSLGALSSTDPLRHASSRRATCPVSLRETGEEKARDASIFLRTGIHGRIALCAAALILSAVATAASAGPADVYFERVLMGEANLRCHLFTPELASALGSAAAQARGAALRSGVTEAAVADVGQNARLRADQTPCGAPDLGVAAARVRAAFDGYAHLQSMTFPGDSADWRAQRSTAMRTMTWRLSQSARFGADRLVFGLAGRAGASGLITAASFADGAQPYAARLVVRDVARAPSPFIGGFSQAGRSGLAGRMPMRTATVAFAAEARDEADASLLPPGAASGVAFRFPRQAADALDGLDPREAVAIDFLFEGPGGETVRTAYIEVGDFAAGRAFLAADQR